MVLRFSFYYIFPLNIARVLIFKVYLSFFLANSRLDDMKAQLRKRMFKKRKIRRVTFSIANGISIELNTYALIRPTVPGTFYFRLR